jgi:hypothetical protein
MISSGVQILFFVVLWLRYGIGHGMTLTPHEDKAMTDKQTFTIRMRADARALLDAASDDQRRSRASILEALVREHLAKYERTENRLERMLNNER